MAEDLGSLLGAARRDLEPASLQALADAVRVAARSDAGRAEAGALPHLVELLASALGDARLSTAWPSTAGAMANLAANSDVNRDALAGAGALARLAAACAASPGPEFDRCAAAALGNIVAENGTCQQAAVDSGCTDALAKLVGSDDAAVRQLAAKACENLGSDPHILQPLVQAGVMEAFLRVVLEHRDSADGALAGLLHLVGALPAEAALARLVPRRGAVTALTAALRCGPPTARLGALAVLQQGAPPSTPLSDDDVAAFDGKLVDALIELILSVEADELTAQLGSAALLRSLALTAAGGSLLWGRPFAVRQLTAAVLRATAAIDTETTEGQELLDQARVRLDCLSVLNALACSEERCVAMVTDTAAASPQADSASAAAEAARELRVASLAQAPGSELEPEPELEPELNSNLAAACVAVSRHKYDLEGTRVAINLLRNLALPAPSCQQLLEAGVVTVFGNAVQHKDPNVGACAAAALRIMVSHSTAVALAVCTARWSTEQNQGMEEGKASGGRGSLVENLLRLDLEKTHPHCRVELARALALVKVAAAEYCSQRLRQQRQRQRQQQQQQQQSKDDADDGGGDEEDDVVTALQALASERGVGFISFVRLHLSLSLLSWQLICANCRQLACACRPLSCLTTPNVGLRHRCRNRSCCCRELRCFTVRRAQPWSRGAQQLPCSRRGRRELTAPSVKRSRFRSRSMLTIRCVRVHAAVTAAVAAGQKSQGRVRACARCWRDCGHLMMLRWERWWQSFSTGLIVVARLA
jgi:hypothetical protein